MDTPHCAHPSLPKEPGPIGIFDSGFGGLTVLREIRALMPHYDYLFLGDNARAPYGTRSYDVVRRYTLAGVEALFQRGCHLVILACNTASAKALRTIQQHDLPQLDPTRRVLGVIRPTAEVTGDLTRSRHVGILATPGTIASRSYDMEIQKLFPDIRVTGEACPMWVPLVENFEYDKPGADYFVRQSVERLLSRDPKTDLIILGCTHFPFLLPKIREAVPEGVNVIAQGEYVARSLEDYLHRHPEIEGNCTRQATLRYLTTEEPERFDQTAAFFMGEAVESEHLD